MTENLTSKTLRALNWSYLATVTNAVMQIGFTAFLARLLDPATFGLMAMARIILRFASYFTTMGIGPALIQKNEIDSDDIRASFTFSVLLSLLFFACFWVAAPFSLYLFNNPEVVMIVRAMALTMVLEGFSITATSLLRRRLEFRLIAIIEVGSFVLGYGAVGVILAWMKQGVWSLVIASLSQAAIVTLLSNLFARHSFVPRFAWKYYRNLLSYGSKFSLISFSQFIYYAVQPILIGRQLGATVLGYFTNAQNLANLPFEYLISAFNKVLFPALSRQQKELGRMRKAYLSAYLLVSLLIFPTAFGMIPAADQIVLLLVGSKWIPSIGLFQVLLVAVPFSFLNSLNGVLLDANARLGMKLVIELFSIAVMILLVPLSPWIGISGIVVYYTFVEFLKFVAYVVYVKHVLRFTLAEFGSINKVILINTLIIVGLIGLIRVTTAFLNVPFVISLALEVLTGTMAFVMATFISSPQLVRSEMREIYLRVAGENKQDTKITRLMGYYASRYLGIRPEHGSSLTGLQA